MSSDALASAEAKDEDKPKDVKGKCDAENNEQPAKRLRRQRRSAQAAPDEAGFDFKCWLFPSSLEMF